MLNELATEYAAHIKAGRASEAANCQREAVMIAGVQSCPGWASPAIPEIGFSDYDRYMVQCDARSWNRIYQDHKSNGDFRPDLRHKRDEALSRLAAMSD